MAECNNLACDNTKSIIYFYIFRQNGEIEIFHPTCSVLGAIYFVDLTMINKWKSNLFSKLYFCDSVIFDICNYRLGNLRYSFDKGNIISSYLTL